MVLEMALDRAGVGIDRDGRGGVEVVARALVAEPRRAVAGAPERDVALGVVGPGHPDRGAAALPGLAFPGVVAGLAGAGDGVGLPHRLAALGVERLDEAADAELAARDADHDLAVHDQRRERHVVAFLPVGDRRALPGDLAGRGVERHHDRVLGGEVDLVAVQRDAALGVVQRAEAFGQLALVAPDQVAGLGVERQDLVVGRGDVHDAVVDDRRRLVAGIDAGRVAPDRRQVLDVVGVDLARAGCTSSPGSCRAAAASSRAPGCSAVRR